MATLASALTAARTYLNDDAGSLWTDAALIPKLQEAHLELQTMLWECGSPAVRAEAAAVTVAAGAVIVTQPTDMLTPFKLEEYADTVETIADAVPMTERFDLPRRAQSATLIDWAWKGEIIKFVGASVNRKVIIHYRKKIAIPSASGDPIGVLFGELYLGARAAAIAHGSLGNKEAHEIATATAKANFQKVVAAQRGQQTPMVKP